MDFSINEKIQFGGIDTEPKLSISGSVPLYTEATSILQELLLI